MTRTFQTYARFFALITSTLISQQAHALGELLHTLSDPSPTNVDMFGFSVAIDGNHVLVGAHQDDTLGYNVGQAHLFDVRSGELLHTFDDPTPTSDDFFGHGVAIDDEHILIGATEVSSSEWPYGEAHLFNTSGDLISTFHVPAQVGRGYFLGESVAIDGDRILLGLSGGSLDSKRRGQAHLFDAHTGNLLQFYDDLTPDTFNSFGNSVAIDGDHIVVGAWGNYTSNDILGQVELFDAISGEHLKSFSDPDVSFRDRFGQSVAIEGNRILIGAGIKKIDGNSVGQAYLFDLTTGDLLQTYSDPTITTKSDAFGSSVALDSGRVLIGAPLDDTDGRDIGQAHLFDATTGQLLHTFNDPVPRFRDRFGTSVDIDGNHVVIGEFAFQSHGRDYGEAYVFNIAVPEPLSTSLLLGACLIASVSVRDMQRMWGE